MSLDWSPFVAFVNAHRRFLLMTHRRPDGDGVGSQLALADALRRAGKEVRVAVLGSFPERYRVLDPEGAVAVFDPADPSFAAETDAVVILDTGTWNQIEEFGDFLREHRFPTAVIDHHPTQDGIGEIQMVDTEAEATGRLSREAIAALGVGLSPAAASALFVALAYDTGWFRHSNATARTFELAAELVAAGANPTALNEALHDRNTPGRLRLMRVALERLDVVAGDKIALTQIRQSDYAETGATPEDGEDLIGLPRSLAGVEIALVLTERPDGSVKISFRSRPGYDVGAVAESFGGGGHRLAAGATVAGPLDEVRRRVLDALTPLV